MHSSCPFRPSCKTVLAISLVTARELDIEHLPRVSYRVLHAIGMVLRFNVLSLMKKQCIVICETNILEIKRTPEFLSLSRRVTLSPSNRIFFVNAVVVLQMKPRFGRTWAFTLFKKVLL